MRTRTQAAFPQCAMSCSECGGVMDKKGAAIDIGGMSPFLYRKSALFETPDAAREFAICHGWKSKPDKNIDVCPDCAAAPIAKERVQGALNA